jgi:N-acetyl-1-D-myo-inositol-2-amino-2-deoxy-alpha-D-glucopyranoside deacetylase
MTLTAAPRLLLVHAHPDDESLWTGGTIARYAAAGVQVTLVTCTMGEEGEVIPDSLRELAADAADQLGGYRIAELRAACAALGISDHRWLGGIGRWRDSGMAGVAANAHPRAFAAGDLETQAAALAEVLADVRPQVVVTYGPDGGYGHPDHIRAHEVTMAACDASDDPPDRVFFAVTSRTATEAGLAELAGTDVPFRMPDPGELPVTDDSLITTVIDTSEVVSVRMRAMAAHQTQITVWHGADGERAYALSNGIAQPIPSAEFYLLGRGSGEGAETDLFGGLA